jgi:hypothetical protein
MFRSVDIAEAGRLEAALLVQQKCFEERLNRAFQDC